jgi:hypothetical protein
MSKHVATQLEKRHKDVDGQGVRTPIRCRDLVSGEFAISPEELPFHSKFGKAGVEGSLQVLR